MSPAAGYTRRSSLTSLRRPRAGPGERGDVGDAAYAMRVMGVYAGTHSADSVSACRSTVSVASSCRSGG